MRLYLCRHGEAEPDGPDSRRRLSEKGRGDVARVGEHLGERGVRVSRVVHSGIARARQTAQLLAKRMAPEVKPEAMEGLRPEDPADPVANRIDDFPEDTLVVGHQPFMGLLAARLLGKGERRHAVLFSPGTIACLERDRRGGWRLISTTRPDQV